jgi:exopolysaccharide transport family protein
MAQIGETELDVRALSRALWRKAWLLVLLAVVVAAATYFGLGYVEPLYTADSRILIEKRESPLTRPREQTAESAAEFDESAIQSQVEVLRSREIANAVIDKLDLTHRPELDPATHPSPVASLLVMLGLRQHPADESIRQRVMESYFKRLSVYSVSKSRVIGLEFTAPNPALAAEVANAIADAFVELQQGAKRESAMAATAWLEQEIERLRGRVADAEQAVADYQTKHGLFESQGGGLTSQQLSDLNAELARAKAARSEAEARAQAVQSLLAEGGGLESSQEVLNSELIQRLQEREVALRSQIADLSTTLLPSHPRIRALNEQLQNLEAQIRQEARKIQASLQTAARVAAAREQSLTESLNQAKTDVSQSNEQEIELRALEREAAAQRDLLESFLARYREAVARTDADYLPADARIISRAVEPREPSFPKKTMMSIAAAVAVLLIASVILLLREFTSGRAFRVIDYGVTLMPPLPAEAKPTGEPLRKLAAADVAATEPEPEPEVRVSLVEPPPDDEQPEPQPKQDVVAAEAPVPAESANEPAQAPEPAVEDAERPGTAELAEIVANPAVRLILFAGAQGGEGAGEIAFEAARRAARDQNLRFILLDVGLKPSRALGGDEAPGLGNLLAGEAAFGDVIRRDDASRVHVIPMGATDKNPPLQRLQLAIGALSHTYDKVVVVTDSLDDWPYDYVRPDLAAIVCGPDTTELMRTEVYDAALERGAKNALIVRYTSEYDETGGREESAAA